MTPVYHARSGPAYMGIPQCPHHCGYTLQTLEAARERPQTVQHFSGKNFSSTVSVGLQFFALRVPGAFSLIPSL